MNRAQQPIHLACGRGLVLICSARKVPLTGCWWLICSEKKKYYWLVADKPNEQGVYWEFGTWCYFPVCFCLDIAHIHFF
jgi:hypothetical protein